MSESRMDKVVGVLGGMGPLASAEFVKTIYQFGVGEREQRAPIVFLYSDPTFPDRTEALLAGNGDLSLKPLINAMERLCESGASIIVITCVTIHHLLPKLPRALRERTISLLDVIFADVLQIRRRRLLFCTNGARQVRIFENHSRWELARRDIVMPDEVDQNAVHEIIYRIKRNYDVDQLMPEFEALLEKHEVTSFIAGCTETHLLSKSLMRRDDNPKGYSCVDPLITIAKQIAEGRI